MPVTFMVLIVIWEIGIFGSTGDVASTAIIPVNPEHWARPFASMLTPAGTGCVEKGLPKDQRTGGFAVIGAMLKVPMAMNCTMPLVFLASADAGETVMLCNCLLDIIIELPPQEAVASKRATTTGKRMNSDSRLRNKNVWTRELRIRQLQMNDLRINTSKWTAVKGTR